MAGYPLLIPLSDPIDPKPTAIMPHRTLNTTEAAHFLHLQPSQIERLVKDDAIPCEKRAGKVLFRRVELQAWASHRILGLEGRHLQEYHGDATTASRRGNPGELRISDWIQPTVINPTLPAKTRASVLREMAKLAAQTEKTTDPVALLRGLDERENLCSTGLPGGWALLHTRNHDPYLFEEPVLLLGRTVQNIPFGAPDGRATRLFFLLGCTDDRLHLHALSRLCLMAQQTDLLQTLLDAPDSETMHQAIVTAEESVSFNPTKGH